MVCSMLSSRSIGLYPNFYIISDYILLSIYQREIPML